MRGCGEKALTGAMRPCATMSRIRRPTVAAEMKSCVAEVVAGPVNDRFRDGFRHGHFAALQGSEAVSLSVPNQFAVLQSAAAV